MARINPILLRHFRDKQKMSQDDLKRHSKIDKGTIHRIETGRMTRNSERVIASLAKALKVEPDQLTAAEADRVAVSEDGFPFPKSQLNVRIAPETRNALALVSQRYGVSTLDVIEFAPFLFHLVASESLKARADVLAALRAARESVSAFGGRFNHLTERMMWDWQAEEIEVIEERSIATRDLRGTSIDEANSITDPRPMDYDEDEANPFITHLRERLAAVGADDSADRLEGWYNVAGVRYQICREESLSWFGGDEDAADDFVAGRFSITDMPKAIRTGAWEERVAWAVAKREETCARTSDYFASLGLGDLL